MIQSSLLVVLVGFLGAAPAGAAPAKVAVKILLADDVKLGDEDIFVVWNDACTEKPKEKKVSLRQSGNKYEPRALVAQVGQVLSIHNSDKIKHNSFALKAVKFDSGLQDPDSTNEVKLDKPGVTNVFCRIHPSMVSRVLVLNNKCHVTLKVSDVRSAKGATLDQASPGGKIWLWSPSLKAFHSRKVLDGGTFSLSKADFIATVKTPSPAPGGEVY